LVADTFCVLTSVIRGLCNHMTVLAGQVGSASY